MGSPYMGPPFGFPKWTRKPCAAGLSQTSTSHSMRLARASLLARPYIPEVPDTFQLGSRGPKSSIDVVLKPQFRRLKTLLTMHLGPLGILVEPHERPSEPETSDAT